MRFVHILLRGSIVGLFHAVAAVHVPERFDALAKRGATFAIRLYQLLLSPILGRQCLFHPTCSSRSLTLLQLRGWNNGMPAAATQLRRCCGNFRVGLTETGEIELEAYDGVTFRSEELSCLVHDRYGQSAFMGDPSTSAK
jgi:putative component of membrane protein insertase Oxa1/YidC/SpoIIIJ protein YidD